MQTDQHATDTPGHAGFVDHHDPADHGDDHGHDDHAHRDPALGPIDVRAWGAAILGVALGAVIVIGFAMATTPA
jgi:hypothetical protein